uniref:PAS domain-containing protein n=1 Tax=Plectus sambesii TaxID=2011161 RepID=A0A914X020_9BILA
MSALIPACTGMPKKLDKLTVLRLAVQHIKSIGSSESDGDDNHIPKCLPMTEAITLIEEAAPSFVVATRLDTGAITAVSDTVEMNTGWSVSNLLSRSWFDLLHPDDVAAFKANVMTLSATWQNNGDGNDMVSSSTSDYMELNSSATGAKRFFQCRIKLNPTSVVAAEKRDNYTPVRCYGFIKTMARIKSQSEQYSESDEHSPSILCAVFSVVPSEAIADQSDFVVKLSVDGRIIQCNEAITRALGYFPQQVAGHSYYDLVHEGDLLTVSNIHKLALKSDNRQAEEQSGGYRLRTSKHSFLSFDTRWERFTNPWTGKHQFLVVRHRSKQATEISTEISPQQSTLKQLLTSSARPHAVSQHSPVLGAARFGSLILDN